MNLIESTDYSEYLKKKREAKLDYIKSLLDPFGSHFIRAPACVKVPTALLRDVSSFQITIGTAGDFVALFCPENLVKNGNNSSFPDWFYAARNSTSTNYSGISYLQHATTAATNYASQGVSSTLTYGAYMQHARLVSSGFRMKYIGRADAHSGLIIAGALPVNNPGLQTALVSNEVNELMFATRLTPLQGMTINWLPQDESSLEFKQIQAGTPFAQSGVYPQLAYAIYGFGLPAGTVLDVEVIRKYEYIPPYNFIELLLPEADHAHVAEDLPMVNDVIKRNAQSLSLGSTNDVIDSVQEVLELARALI